MLSATRWQALWQELGGTAPAGSFAELSAAYGAADRHYHGAAHITACLAHLDRWRSLAADAALVELLDLEHYLDGEDFADDFAHLKGLPAMA